MSRLIIFCFLLFTWFPFVGSKAQNYAIVVHGGAGNISPSEMDEATRKAYQDKLVEATQAGLSILEKGGSSLDAVETAVKILEDSPLFNAGKGAVFNAEGKNELDASIMCGKSLEAGSVAGVTTIKNPISAARMVMEHSPHVMLIGKGAETFAQEHGLEIVPPEYFYDAARYNQYLEFKKGTPDKNQKKGTVGAVALDIHGNLAAATSTGGMLGKKYGRVGDSPIIGAGTYANNNSCAVSATGHGEYFIRLNVAFRIAALMEFGMLSLKEASERVIFTDLNALGGTGGIIAVDKNGNIAMPFNTEGMFRAWGDQSGKIIVLMGQ
ncbi:MAG: isoaspartyl peptidase/L-asparaginase [Bacteroidales bacterium]|nr:isoaspartyl peptidase/L-asparaginase [Bacteroidales bacterium]